MAMQVKISKPVDGNHAWIAYVQSKIQSFLVHFFFTLSLSFYRPLFFLSLLPPLPLPCCSLEQSDSWQRFSRVAAGIEGEERRRGLKDLARREAE